MRGWIIYKDNLESLKPEVHAIRRLLEAAPAAGIDLHVYRPDQIDILVNREDRKSVLVEGAPTPLPDFLLPRMGSSTTYFALAVIRHLERLGVPSFNPSFSIEVVKDKLYQLQILAQHHFPIPKTMLAKFPVEVNLVEKRIGFPVVVKAISGSRGSGVFLSPDKASFKDLMQFFEATNKGANIIIQEFIESSHGQDLRVFTIGGRVASIMKRFSTDGSFKANYSRGGGVEPFEITPEIEWLALEVSRILNLDIAGIDLLFDRNGGYKICEVNSSPGFKGMEACCDVDIAQEIFKFVKVRLGR
ncbi:MAG: RimK family alpha-L-glutamate ligase [Bacteroidia bacterium]|nr:RimK family alpha-L-glutamate ligase [Bacteroidia bacterium]